MSRNPNQLRACATRRHRVLATLACCMAAGLGAGGCGGDSQAACALPHDGLATFIEVRDRNGPCTACNAEDGLTFVLGVANGCDDVARFTTPDGCIVNEFLLIKDSGEMVPAPYGCVPAVTDWEMQPGEVMSGELEWERGDDQLSSTWGPIEPGHYRLVMTLDTDLMTDMEIAPPAEVEIIVTQP